MRAFAGARPLWAAVMAFVVFGTTVMTASPAQAGPGDPLYLSVTKSVSNATPAPGKPFTYTIEVVCSEQSCLNAHLDDAFPAELAGYTVENVSFNPSASTIPRAVSWIVGGVSGSSTPATLTADTRLSVDFTGAVTAPTGTGLQNGQTFTVLMTLQVPTVLPPGTTVITNTATTTADNSSNSAGSATITVTMPERIGVAVNKSWTPATQTFQVGRASAIALSATNTSNIPVDSLVVQEPQTAPDSALALDASNAFTLTDFTGFTGFTMPVGATTVQVDAYIFDAGLSAWVWQTGAPAATPTLPAGVTASDVGGLRFTFSGGSINAATSAAVTLNVAQRAADRTGADLSAAVHSVPNVVEATVAAAGHTPVTGTATATHTVNPATVKAATSKSITPNRIAAGSSTVARIVATNASDVGVVELRAADLNYFTSAVKFAGFASGLVWPTGTNSSVVIYHPLGGGADETVAFADGAVPGSPAVAISGFDVVYTSGTGSIDAGSSGTIDFGIATTEGAIGALDTLTTTNSETTTVTASNGLTNSATANANLILLKPAINITLNKTVLPSAAVAPGERVVTKLDARLTTTSDYVTAKQIVVKDSWGGAGTFWDAFDLASFAPAQVPAYTTLAVDVQGPDQSTWVQVASFASSATPFLAGMTQAELETALATVNGGSYVLTAATGIRFTYHNATGFAGDTTVSPYVVSRARATLRSSGLPTAPGPVATVNYQNSGFTSGTGTTVIGTQLSATAQGTHSTTVKPSSGAGAVGIAKAWSDSFVPAQSDAQRSTALSWSVGDGYRSVTITDPTNAATPATSVFDAFDLKSIAAIAVSSTPFSNGWYLKYDTVDSVQIYSGGAWVTVPAPGGGWVNAGTFVGYTLTTAESASATGFRIVLSDNAAARTAATQQGSAYDPYAPEVGSGVVSSSQARTFSLTWQLRDKMRVSGAWVTDRATYNTVDKGVVDNTAQLDATPLVGGGDVTATASDSILITNPGPGVTVTKTVLPTSELYVPMEGTPASNFPTAAFTIGARNNSVSAASYVRVMDSPLCTDADAIGVCEGPATAAGAVADPFTPGVQWLTAAGQGNPFDRFDLTKVTISASITAQVDLGASTVWLLRYSAGTYSTTTATATAVNAMTTGALSDVVGVSVTFQGTDPVTAGGSISSSDVLTVKLDTRLRTNLRVSDDPQTLAANAKVNVVNRAFAQSYDPVLNDGVATGAVTAATAKLTGGDINVAALKSISPAALTEPTRNGVVTVTIGANQGFGPVSSLAPAEVRLTDDAATSPDFWNNFTFTGLGALIAPAGSDQVVVSVYGPFGSAGAMAWVSGAASPVAGSTVPVSVGQYADVQGLKLAFSRVGGGFFSNTMPAAQWSTSSTFTVRLRDRYRDSGNPMVLAGSVANTVTVVSDRLNGESSAERTSAAQISLSPGTYTLKVKKLANAGDHTASAGESVPWDLTFTNTGTGYLTINELRDTLPTYLEYLGDVVPAYTPDASGLLGAPTQMAQVGNDLVFTWPANERTMAPGETFSVRVMLEVQPGLAAGDRATNEMQVTTAETLASCSNIDNGGTTTGAWASNRSTCGTTDYVTPTIGPNLFTIKGVRGALAGASNPANPSQECRASLNATGGSYFRAPCAANSYIGGVDHWVLRAQNAGTTGVNHMVIFDPLPAKGDTYLISGSSRASTYRPQMLNDLTTTAPAGTTMTVEVTTSAHPCDGTWAGLEGQEPCEQDSEVWTAASAGTDWIAVTAFRITLDFSTTQGGVLTPGEFVDVTFSTKNVAATAADPSGADVDVPIVDSYAWNQFGVKYLNTGASLYRKIAPARTGIHLGIGSLRIDKILTGQYSNFLPKSFVVGIACTVQGAPVNMGAFSSVALNSVDGFSRVIDGLPLGSECTMTETASGGASLVSFTGTGVARVSSTSATVTVGSGTTIVTLTNSFEDPLAFTGATGIAGLILLALALLGLGLFLVERARRRIS